MRKGYLNLLESLRLLTREEVAKDIEWYGLQTATGQNIRADEVHVGVSEIFAKQHGEGTWHQFPNDELVGISVEFGVSAKEPNLPAVLGKVRKEKVT
jgi:hypothetical protein